MLLFLTVDALIANWTLDPIWNLLYARIQLNLFYNSHAVSILAICAAAWWMAVKQKDGFPIAVFAAFGTASIHELMLDGVDILVYRQDSGISPSYGSVLAIFLVVGFVLSKKYHRKVWLITAITMFLWFLILTAIPHWSTISPKCDFCPSDDFYNPLANIEEVVSWIAPAALWFLPRRWFNRPASL